MLSEPELLFPLVHQYGFHCHVKKALARIRPKKRYITYSRLLPWRDVAPAILEQVDCKWNLVEQNSQNIMSMVQATRQNLENVNMAMQGKMLEIWFRQEGQRMQQQQQDVMV